MALGCASRTMLWDSAAEASGQANEACRLFSLLRDVKLESYYRASFSSCCSFGLYISEGGAIWDLEMRVFYDAICIGAAQPENPVRQGRSADFLLCVTRKSGELLHVVFPVICSSELISPRM